MSAVKDATVADTVEAICSRFGHVPLRLSADVILPAMTMRMLQSLKPGTLLCSKVSVADDLLLTLGAAPICWGRFASVDGHMIVRVVRLA